jgi:hypothetical protein
MQENISIGYSNRDKTLLALQMYGEKNQINTEMAA